MRRVTVIVVVDVAIGELNAIKLINASSVVLNRRRPALSSESVEELTTGFRIGPVAQRYRTKQRPFCFPLLPSSHHRTVLMGPTVDRVRNWLLQPRMTNGRCALKRAGLFPVAGPEIRRIECC